MEASTASESETSRRIQFDFSPEAHERFIALKERAGVSTHAELVRRTLQVFEWILDKRDEGYNLALVRDDDDKVRELHFFF